MVVKDPAQDWKVRASIALLTALLFVSVSAASMAAWWQWGPTNPPFKYVDPQNDFAVVRGDGLLLKRTLRVERRVELSATRDLVRTDGQKMLRIRLPESRAVYDPGTYDLERVLELPGPIPPGTYALDNVVHWRANPLREGYVRLPPISVVIP